MGLFDFLKPVQTVVPGEVLHDPRVGDLQTAPQLGAKEGFLDRLRKPDERGVTFGDKLYAAGAIAQGDSQGGMSHIQNARATADKADKDARSQAVLKQRSAAFKAAMATGQFDPAVYAQMADTGFDPGEAAEMTKAFKPHYEFLQSQDGGVQLGDLDHGTVEQRGAPSPHLSGGYIWDPATQTMRAVPGGPADASVIQRNAYDRRRAIVDNPVPQRARAGGRAKSYGAGDVDWGH